MKKIFITLLLGFFGLVCYGQLKAPKGIQVGRYKTGSDVVPVDSVTVKGSKISFYKEAALLNISDNIILTTVDQTNMRNSAWWVANTSYDIRDSINLGGVTVTFPANVALKVNGGKLANGVLNGNHSRFIVDETTQIFDTTITFTGSWQNGNITLQNFGAKTNANGGIFEHSVTPAFNACIKSPFAVIIPSGYYYIDKTIKINKPKHIICYGEAIKGIDAYNDSLNWQTGSAVIYTEKNIDFVTIQSKEVFWDGGVLDAFKAWNNTHALFRYDYNYANLEGRLKFSGRGNINAIRKMQNGPIGVHFNSNGATVDNGAAMSIEIQANLLYLWYGVVIEPNDWVSQGGTHNSWTTAIDMNINTWACAQPFRIYTNQGGKIEGYTQAFPLFLTTTARDTMPEMYLGKDAHDMVIDVMFWDVIPGGASVGGYYRHAYAVFNYGRNNKFSDRTMYAAQYMGTEGDMALTYNRKSIVPSKSLFHQTNNNGITRPFYPRIGEMFFDTYLGKPIWYDGFRWVDAIGAAMTWDRVFSLDDNIAAYWRFDETSGTVMQDATTNDIDATVKGGATINQTGKLGKCVYFDGTLDSLTFAPIELGYIDFSFAAWVKFTGSANGKIIGGTASRDIYWEVVNSTSKLRFGVQGYGNLSTSALTITKDQWTHIVIAVDKSPIGKDTASANIYTYINGRYAGMGNVLPTYINNDSEISVIGSNVGLAMGFTGYIDELGIWKRKLTMDEAWTLHNYGQGYDFSNFVDSWQYFPNY